uniref:FK506-binding protein n=1 Tax=Daphnia galeata TaxID=27404 RepID=A0A8J2RYP6_9CRUS|nr:unnamed protein product [Daphnia galeata]
MFWGLIIEPGKKYSQTVDSSFHISKATLDLSSATDEDITLLLDYEGQQEYILCHLNKGNKQESLDLNFQSGDSISLFTHGQASIHLSGYLLGDDDDDDMTLGDMLEEEEEEEEIDEEMEGKDLRATLQAKAVKRAQPEKSNGKAQKKPKVEMDEEDDDDEEEEAEAEEEEEPKQPSPKPLTKSQKKKEKKAQQQQQQQQSPKPAAAAPQQPQKKKEGASPAGKPQQQQQNKNKKQKQKANDSKTKGKVPESPAKQTLPGGLVVEDLKVGSGPESKKGDMVAVYYNGKLAKNGKQFDQTNKGPGFKFKLGQGRVIKGWDLGVAGMKVGGKRKLTIPASLAYGAGGAPPQIPPHSTLVFEVELKALN